MPLPGMKSYGHDLKGRNEAVIRSTLGWQAQGQVLLNVILVREMSSNRFVSEGKTRSTRLSFHLINLMNL